MPPFRVFGSPYTLALHQHVTYLRLKQLPFKVYCTSFTTTLLYSFYYKARNAFCTVTPSGESTLQLWQLVELAELNEDLQGTIASSGHLSDVHYSPPPQSTPISPSDAPLQGASSGSSPASSTPTGTSSDTVARTPTQRILVNKHSHPTLHLAQWVTVVYACWWLAKTGAMYRWVLGDSLDVVEGYVRYFFFTVGGIGPARTIAPKFRLGMQKLTAVMGISQETAPFMDEHFRRMCSALELHFQQHPDFVFVLGTPHPTLADVTLGSAFSAFFLMDDPPAATISELYPHLLEYAERVTGWRGAVFTDSTPPAASASATTPTDATENSAIDSHHEDYPDSVPESLEPFFEVITEVFPFLMSQCAAFNAYMSSDAIQQLKREPLEGKWKGCHGYLFPQLTNIKSLMIIDNAVLTVQARAQDLEIAFMAAREVSDDTLGEFGRILADTTDEAEHVEAYEGARRTVEGNERSATKPNKSRPEAASPETSSMVPSQTETSHSGSALHASYESAEALSDPDVEPIARIDLPTADRWRHNPRRAAELQVDDADYYRAFTSKGARTLAGVTQDRASMVTPSASARSGEGLVTTSGVSVLDRLDALREMLRKMQSPQYTVTSLYLGRRMFVAAIPEYEVAKVRHHQHASTADAKGETV